MWKCILSQNKEYCFLKIMKLKVDKDKLNTSHTSYSMYCTVQNIRPCITQAYGVTYHLNELVIGGQQC